MVFTVVLVMFFFEMVVIEVVLISLTLLPFMEFPSDDSGMCSQSKGQEND